MPLLSRRRRFHSYATHTRLPPTGVLTFTVTDITQVYHQSGDGLLFAGVNIGLGASDRYVVVALAASASTDVVSVQAGSINLARAVGVTVAGFQFNPQVWFGKVQTGTAADIVVTCGSFIQSVSIAAGILTGFDNVIVSTSQTVPFLPVPDPHSISSMVHPGEIGVLSCGLDRNMASNPVWTNAIGDVRINEIGQNATCHLMAHTTNSNPSFTGADGFSVGMAMAVFAGAP